MTSVNVTNGQGVRPGQPVQQRPHASTTPTARPSSRPARAPVVDRAGSTSATEPQVLHVPEVKDHYFVLALLDPYTEDLRNLGSAHSTAAGRLPDRPSRQHGERPRPGPSGSTWTTTRIWVIGSTQLKGPDDVTERQRHPGRLHPHPTQQVRHRRTRPRRRTTKDTTVDMHALPTGMAFLDTLGQQLDTVPPAGGRQAPARDRWPPWGSAREGHRRRTPSLSADTVRGLTDAIAAGPAQIQADTKSAVRDERHQARRLPPGRLRHATAPTTSCAPWWR